MHILGLGKFVYIILIETKFIIWLFNVTAAGYFPARHSQPIYNLLFTYYVKK